MKNKPHIKAYFIKWLPSDNEAVVMGWMSAIVCAETEKLARIEALRQLREYDIEDDHFGNPFSYISIRLRRSPEYDRFLVDGRIKTREDIDYDRKKSERDTEFRKIANDHPNSYAYIQKGGYYYRPNSSGYTEYKTEAGIYTIKQAINECLCTSLGDFMRPILINSTEHNVMINKQIESLKTRLINA